ncbi:MAG: hypothetical protein RML36_07245 [Anaerolineae bacterium]|nr:hypothetical protein [Anaerolineae bacterium]MDW8099265.1 hypothetical protein [Anaerolineae bacterium]
MKAWSKPTVDTKFHIDYEWWKRNNLDFRLYLRNQLCPQCQERFTDHRETEIVDWVDPDTGEVKQTDALLECLRTYCVHHAEFISPQVPLAAAAFRLLLVNENRPMSPREMHKVIHWRSPEAILQVLAGKQIYLGIRPVSEN